MMTSLGLGVVGAKQSMPDAAAAVHALATKPEPIIVSPDRDQHLTTIKLRLEREREGVLRRRKHIVTIMSCVLQQMFSARDDKLPANTRDITVFHTASLPGISIRDYFLRIAQYSDCSAEAMILSLVHLNRILYYRPDFEINSLTIHRLLLTGIMCAAKFFDDHYYNNSYYARIGGVKVEELNELEVVYLSLINFDMLIQPAVFRLCFEQLVNADFHRDCGCVLDNDINPLSPYDCADAETIHASDSDSDMNGCGDSPDGDEVVGDSPLNQSISSGGGSGADLKQSSAFVSASRPASQNAASNSNRILSPSNSNSVGTCDTVLPSRRGHAATETPARNSTAQSRQSPCHAFDVFVGSFHNKSSMVAQVLVSH